VTVENKATEETRHCWAAAALPVVSGSLLLVASSVERRAGRPGATKENKATEEIRHSWTAAALLYCCIAARECVEHSASSVEGMKNKKLPAAY